MFDWLFGKTKDQALAKYQDAADQQQINQKVNDFYKEQLNGIYNDPANSGLLADMRKTTPGFDDAWKSQMSSLDSKSEQLKGAASDANAELEKQKKKQKNNVFGDGLLGSFLNPIAQTVGAVSDLATGNYKDRDVGSDLAAAGETLLTALPGIGAAAKAAKLGKVAEGLGAVNKALYTIPGSAATGAVMGGLDKVRTGETDDALNGALLGGIMGGAIPGAMKVGGNFLKNRGEKAFIRNSIGTGVDPNVALETMPSRALYQEGLRSLIPKSAVGKLALGGGALYGGSQLMGALNPQQGVPDEDEQANTLNELYKRRQGGMF